MRLLTALALGLGLCGCTVRYTDSNAAQNAARRTISGSGTTASSGSSASSSVGGSTGASSGAGTSSSGATGSTSTASSSSSSAGDTSGSSSSSGDTSGSSAGSTTAGSTSSGTASSSSSSSSGAGTASAGTTGSPSSSSSSSSSSSGSTGAGGFSFEKVTADGDPGSDDLADVGATPDGTYLAMNTSSSFWQWSASMGWFGEIDKGDFSTKMAIDADGDIWASFTNSGTAYLGRLGLDGGVLATVGSRYAAGWVDGALGSSRFDKPAGVAIDAFGNLVVADQNNNDIRYVDLDAGQVSTIAGAINHAHSSIDSNGGGGLAATFDAPGPLAIGPDGTIYVVDTAECLVRAIQGHAPWNVTTVAGSACCPNYDPSDNADPLQARFCPVTGITVDSAGNIFVTDTGGVGGAKLREISSAGVTTVDRGGLPEFSEMQGVRAISPGVLLMVTYGDIWRVTY